MDLITVIVAFLLAGIIYLIINNTKDCKQERFFLPNTNINDRIANASMNYAKDISKYNIGAKSYEYDFIDNEQPINGLGPNLTQDYVSTLPKSNKMFVDQDLSVKYINLLNTNNNSIKNYYSNPLLPMD